MNCPKCGYVRRPDDKAPETECPKCGVIYAKARSGGSLALARARSASSIYNMPDQQQVEFLAEFPASTTDALPGREINSTVGLVFGQSSHAFDAIGEGLAGLARNIAGSGRSPLAEKILVTARNNALAELKFAACKIGADAVVGVRFDFEEISGANGRGIIIVAASGTAVALA